MIVALFYFLIPAMAFVLVNEEVSGQNQEVRNLGVLQKVELVVLLFLLLTSYYYILNIWRADYYYNLGEKENKKGEYQLAYDHLTRAIDLNLGEPVYRNEIAESAANLAVAAMEQKNATAASQLMQEALYQSQTALKISPKNLNFHKGQIKMYFNFTQINTNFLPLVIDSLKSAINLAPTDPKLKYNLGAIYIAAGQNELAIETFKETIKLKSNYKDPYYGLAVVYKETGKTSEAKKMLTHILENLDRSDAAAQKLLQEINNIAR